MQIKESVQGLLIYQSMFAYLLAWIASIVKKRLPSRFFYALGFLLALAAFIYRGFHVQHVPLQNLFEVFLCLGMVVYPISVFCRRFLSVGGETGDMLIGFIVLFPAGFVFSEQPRPLPPALQSWLFAPHVAVYMLAYIVMAKAGFQAACDLLKSRDVELSVDSEAAAYRMVRLGFPLLTLGLILGSVWAKLAWGRYWGWDPKELWSLATWLVYVGYFHFRFMYGGKYRRWNCIWVLLGLLFVVITLLWVNLSRIFSGLHSYAT